MNRHGPCRPSLKITRLGDQTQADGFCVEVWNPFAHAYQQVNSVEEGVARVARLANLIARMWLDQHPKQIALMDVPTPAESTGRRWAELRISGTAFRSYDVRSDDRPMWAKATGLNQAAATICAEVGWMHSAVTPL